MSQGEIKAIINRLIIIVLKLINKPCSCSELPKSYYDMVNVQRLVDWVDVKPQANGGRKILLL